MEVFGHKCLDVVHNLLIDSLVHMRLYCSSAKEAAHIAPPHFERADSANENESQSSRISSSYLPRVRLRDSWRWRRREACDAMDTSASARSKCKAKVGHVSQLLAQSAHGTHSQRDSLREEPRNSSS